MSRVEHYRGLQTKIDSLYSSIKQELESEKSIKIVSEIKGEMNGKPLRSIPALINLW
ncbi:MAG: hypothetical protein WCF23_01815 [Candidatus Nitrosopolaris sp.]